LERWQSDGKGLPGIAYNDVLYISNKTALMVAALNEHLIHSYAHISAPMVRHFFFHPTWEIMNTWVCIIGALWPMGLHQICLVLLPHTMPYPAHDCGAEHVLHKT